MATAKVIREAEHFSIDETSINNLKFSVRGMVIQREDSVYETERMVYNGMIDKHPFVIIKCSDAADVVTALRFAQEHRLVVSIRGGGHNAGGLGVVDDGLVIDLSMMKGIQVNNEKNTVRVEAGCLLRDVDAATQPFGKAVPTGVFGTTGIAGLTLGGGLGYLSRAYGLAIDNLVEADVVLADGRQVTASEEKHSDLFWAIRGGGGNFGVVTAFVFRMHPAGSVYGGPMLWHYRDSEVIMKRYRDFILRAPNDVYGWFGFLTVPPVPLFPEQFHLKQMCAIVWCVLQEKNEAAKSVDAIRTYKTPALDYTGEMPFAALQSMFDALYPKGLQWYWKADFVKELSDEAIKLNVKHGERMPTPHSTMHLYPINGAVHNKSNADSAFAYRDANFAQVIVGVDPDPAKQNLLATWAKGYWEALHPFSAGGAYVNFMMEEGEERIKTAYRGNYDKLVRIKNTYDPQNIFAVNQNIVPTAQPISF